MALFVGGVWGGADTPTDMKFCVKGDRGVKISTA